MGISEIIAPLAMLFMIIIPGFVFSRKNLINEIQSNGISTVIINLTWPCLIIDAMQVGFSKEVLINCGYISVIIIAASVIAFILAKILCKAIKLETYKTYLFTFMLLFANTGFMGIPIINALYSKEAVFYAALLDMVFDIFIYTVGIMLIQKSTSASAKASFKEFLSPGVFAIVLGFTMFLFDFRLPETIGGSVRLIGAATTPLAMFLIGYQLGKINMKELLGDINIYVLAAAKLLVIPAILFAIMHFTIGNDSLLAKVIVLEMSMPVAACTVLFTQQYRGDVAFATKGVLLTSVLSILTIPIFAIILQM